MQMKLRLLFIAIIFTFSGVFSYGQLLQWNTFGNSGNETFETSIANDPNIAVSNLTLGAGVTPAGNANRFGGTAWFDTGDANPTTLAESIAGNDYIQFVVSPNGGFSFTPTSFSFYWERSGSGPNQFALRSSADGYSANLGTVNFVSITTSHTINISGLANVTSATTFRLYAAGATGTTGTGGFDIATNAVNVILNGTTTASGIVSTQSGKWTDGTTWVGGFAPTDGQYAIIASGHTVFADTSINRTIGTSVIGAFELRDGGDVTGTAFTYNNTSGTLNFRTSGSFPVNAASPFWPSAAATRPVNVNVVNGGITLNSSRIVDGNFTTGNGGLIGVTIASPSTLTVNGTVQINNQGFFNVGNSPIYGSASTLIYNPGGTFSRGYEWTAASGTIGTTQGYPNNVQVKNNTTLDYNNGGATPKAMNGDLTIDGGSSLYMNFGSISSLGALTVNGNVNVSGNLTLGTAIGDDLKIGKNFSVTATGVFNGNNRAVNFFSNSAVQTIWSVNPLTIPYIVIEPASGVNNLRLLSNLNVSAPAGGFAIDFKGAGSHIFDINGQTLSVGTSGVGNVINGAGTFKGSATSNMTLLGNGSVGTIAFTTGAQELGTFTVNRTAGSVGVALSTALTINSSLVLTNGNIDLGNQIMTIGASATITQNATPANSFVIADIANGTSAELRRMIPASGTYLFPIGDSAGSADGSQHSPITATFSATGTYGGYAGFVVNDVKEPNLDAAVHFITRYWKMTSSGIAPATYNISASYLPVDVVGTESLSRSNQWNGTTWLNNGTPGGTNVLTLGNATTLPAVNHFTKGYRNADININQAGTQYIHTSTYNFGSLLVGGTSDVTFTVQNLGDEALSFSAVSSPSAPFSLLAAFSLANLSGPNGTRTFVIRFAPTAAGPFTGSISFTTNDAFGSESPYVINFTGVGVSPAPEINVVGVVGANPSIASGDTTPQGTDNTLFAMTSTTQTKSFRIENNGSATLNVSSITVTGVNPSDFIVTQESPYVISHLAGSNFIEFTITFSPSGSGVRSAIINIQNDDSDENPYTFMVQGTGSQPEITVHGNGIVINTGSSSASLTNDTQFGNANVTGGTVVNTFTVSNIGDVDLLISAVNITGADASQFILTTSPAGTVDGDSAKDLVITFDPTTLGVKNALVTISNNDGNESSYTFAIQGTGIDFTECGLGVVEVIAQNTFEPAPAVQTLTYTYTQESGAGIVAEAGGSGRGTSRTVNTNMFLGTRSLQAAGYSTNSATQKVSTIDFATVDASAFKDVSLSFQLGAYGISSTTQGPDIADRVSVFISTNNGATYSQEIDISGSSNSIWSVISSTGTASETYDGNDIAALFSPVSNSINVGPRDITLLDLPNSSQLKIRLVIAIDRTDEAFAIDNIMLSGRKSAISTWNGTSWTPSAPTSTTAAVINGNYANGNISACKCQVNAPFTVTIAANQYFDIQSEIINNGTITVESNGSIIQHNNAAANTGTAYNIKRTTTPYKKFDYTYWSSPVANAAIGATFPTWRLDYAFQFVTSSFADVVAPLDGFDDDGNAWQNVASGATMTPGKGYAIMAPTTGTFPATSTVNFAGAINNGVVTIPLALSANGASAVDDFNLLGNPYPSAISGNAFINQNTNTSGTLYFWTHNVAISGSAPGPDTNNFITTDYAMYNLTGGTASGTGSAQPTGNIASGQGFFVEAINATNVTFNNAMRNATYSNNNFYRLSEEAVTPAVDEEKDRIWLNLRNDNGLFSQMLLGYFEEATTGFDRGYDGIVNKSENSVSFYSFIESDKYRIQGKPAFVTADVTPLGYSSTIAGTFTVEINDREGILETQDVYLEDKVTGLIHNLNVSPYIFSTAIGTFNDRFVLRYMDSTLGQIDNQITDNEVLTYAKDGSIFVKSVGSELGKISVYDVVGHQLFSREDIMQNQFSMTEIKAARQPLILVITLADNQVVIRKIIF